MLKVRKEAMKQIAKPNLPDEMIPANDIDFLSENERKKQEECS